MSKIKISVLIPNFNHGNYLGLQLDSMLEQTRLPDEIIIIDDASTDNSLEVIEKYVKKYAFIKLIKNKNNHGVEYNINKLLDHAKGDYVFLSAADDKVFPIFFEEVEKAALKYPEVGVISGIVRLMDADGIDQGIRMMPIISQNDIYLDASAVKKTLAGYGRWIQISAMVLKKEYIEAVGGQDQEIGSFADNFLATLIASKHGAYFIPKQLGYWRKMETGYGYLSGSDVKNLLNQGNTIGRRMKIDYQEYFEIKFIKRFLSHWIYMIFQNLDNLDIVEKKRVLNSEAFADLCKLAELSKTKTYLLTRILGTINNKYLAIMFLFPKIWLFRSRNSVRAYSGKTNFQEF